MTISPPLRLMTSVSAFFLIAAPLPALAQISPTNQIIGCQSIDNNVARLECFDQVASRLNTLTKKPISRSLAPVISKSAPMTPKASTSSTPMSTTETTTYTGDSAIKSESQGKSIIKDFGKDMSQGPKPKEAALLTPKGDVVFTVKHVQIFDHVKKRFYMTNGQVWEQTTAANLDIEAGKPPANTTAEISKSGFGGYKLKINDKKWGVKVKRVR